MIERILTRNGHNSGSRSPFDILTSALDRTFRDLSNGHSFRAFRAFGIGFLNQFLIRYEILKNIKSLFRAPQAIEKTDLRYFLI